MKKLIMNGRLRLTLTPLLKDIPFVGTIQASMSSPTKLRPGDCVPEQGNQTITESCKVVPDAPALVGPSGSRACWLVLHTA